MQMFLNIKLILDIKIETEILYIIASKGSKRYMIISNRNYLRSEGLIQLRNTCISLTT